VLVSFAVTELLLRRRRFQDVRVVLVVLTAVNLALSPRAHRAVGGAITVLASASAAVGLVDGGGSSAVSNAAASAPEGTTPVATILTPPPPLPTFAVQLVGGALRALALTSGFAGLAYFDVRNLRQQPYTLMAYARELGSAGRLVLPVFPFLVAGFSCVFLVLSSALVKLGVPEALGEELIVYGQFYAPFSAVYWIIKKDWLSNGRGAPPLPVAAVRPSGTSAAAKKRQSWGD